MANIFLSDMVNNKFRFSSSHFPKVCAGPPEQGGPPAPAFSHMGPVFRASPSHRFILLVYSLSICSSLPEHKLTRVRPGLVPGSSWHVGGAQTFAGRAGAQLEGQTPSMVFPLPGTKPCLRNGLASSLRSSCEARSPSRLGNRSCLAAHPSP